MLTQRQPSTGRLHGNVDALSSVECHLCDQMLTMYSTRCKTVCQPASDQSGLLFQSWTRARCITHSGLTSPCPMVYCTAVGKHLGEATRSENSWYPSTFTPRFSSWFTARWGVATLGSPRPWSDFVAASTGQTFARMLSILASVTAAPHVRGSHNTHMLPYGCVGVDNLVLFLLLCSCGYGLLR